MGLHPVEQKQVTIEDTFWSRAQQIVNEVMIPYQWEALSDKVEGVEPSYAISNFEVAAGRREGTVQGRVFQDSDVAKWLEAVAHSLKNQPDADLEAKADAVIALVEEAQGEDGYLNTHFSVLRPEDRWTNLREDHELYCAGHMIEAGVAYYQATGKRRLLDVVMRFADYIGSVFGTQDGQKRGYPGHEEIELALVKLYRVTQEERYLHLSKYFIDERGNQPHYYDIEAEARGEGKNTRQYGRWDYSYSQAHVPVRQQSDADGHSVRAMYLYAGMVDVAAETGDQELMDACRRLWESTVHKRMYITAGIGSTEYGEAFTFDYDLPNDTVYAETCASIGLVFLAQRMLSAELKGEYGDVMERALYNGVLSGMSVDGRSFFYVNPLEVHPPSVAKRHDLSHVHDVRQGWFGCACCPPNLARLLASLEEYIYSQSEDTVAVHLFVGGRAQLTLGNTQVELTQQTEYPWQHKVELSVNPEVASSFTVAIRMPGWCQEPDIEVNGESIELDPVVRDGYAYLTRNWQPDDMVVVNLPMDVQRIYAHPNVRENVGKVALQRGPMVYCLEEVDNGSNLASIVLPQDAALSVQWEELLGSRLPIVTSEAKRVVAAEANLYAAQPPHVEPHPLRAVPYYLWNNRGPGEMLVWIGEA